MGLSWQQGAESRRHGRRLVGMPLTSCMYLRAKNTAGYQDEETSRTSSPATWEAGELAFLGCMSWVHGGKKMVHQPKLVGGCAAAPPDNAVAAPQRQSCSLGLSAPRSQTSPPRRSLPCCRPARSDSPDFVPHTKMQPATATPAMRGVSCGPRVKPKAAQAPQASKWQQGSSALLSSAVIRGVAGAFRPSFRLKLAARQHRER